MLALTKWFDVRPGERLRFWLLFFAFFVDNIGVSWSSSSVAAIILNELGSQFVAQGLVFYGIATVLASVVYTAFVDRIPRHRLLVIMTLISAGLVGAVVLALLAGFRAFAAVGLFVLSESILLIWVLQWNTALLDYYDARTSKRLVPLLNVARLVGVAFGGFTYPLLTDGLSLTADAIVILWFVILVIVLAILWALPRILKDPPEQWPKVTEGYFDSIREGLASIGRMRYLQLMMWTAVLMNALIALFQFRSGVIVENYFGVNIPDDPVAREAAIGNFFAQIEAYSSLVMLFVQLLIFPRLMRVLGLGNINLVYPFAMMLVSVGLIAGALDIIPLEIGIIFAGAATIGRNSFRRVFRTPINGLLINAVPSKLKGRSRSVINGIISPIAVIFIGVAAQIESAPLFAGVLAVVTIWYAWSAVTIRREYGQAMVQLLKDEDYAALLARDLQLEQIDGETLRLLAQRLKSDEALTTAGFMAAVLVEAGGEEAGPLLAEALQNVDTERRQRILRTLIEEHLVPMSMRPYLAGLAASAQGDERALALQALSFIIPAHDSAFVTLVRDHLHDVDYRVRLAVAEAVLRQGKAHAEQQRRARMVLAASLREHDRAVRLATIDAWKRTGDIEGARQLIWLMDEDDNEIRQSATQAIEQLWQPGMPDDIVQMLLEREAMLLDDPVESIRQAELSILRYIGNERARQTLVRALSDASPSIRQAAIDSLVGMGREALATLEAVRRTAPPPQRSLALVGLCRIDRASYRVEATRVARHNLELIDDYYARIVAIAPCVGLRGFGVLHNIFEETIERLLDDTFMLLTAAYGDALRTVRDTLHSENKRTRSNAIEALESTVNPDIARLISPLAEASVNRELLARRHAERVGQPTTAMDVLRMAVQDDSWMQAVAMIAIGAVGTQMAEVRMAFDLPLGPTMQNSRCGDSLDADELVRWLQAGLTSEDADVRAAAQSAQRRVGGGSTITQPLTGEMQMLATIERMIYLKNSPFFQSLTVDQLKNLAAICDEQFVKAGQIIFRRNDPGGSLFVVVSGQVSVGLYNDDGAMIILARYGTNSIFGEMSLFGDSPRSADAMAAEDTLMLTLRRAPFLMLVRQYPELAVHLITELSDRLRHANQQISELTDAGRANINE